MWNLVARAGVGRKRLSTRRSGRRDANRDRAQRVERRNRLYRRLLLDPLEERRVLATVSISANDNAAAETGDTGQWTISRSSADASPLSVYLSYSGTAVSADYSSLPSFVTIPANQTSTTLTLSPVTDNLKEGSETVIATIGSHYMYQVGSPSNATITITDDPPVVTVTANDPSAAEAGPDTGQFTLTRSGGKLSEALTVAYSFSGTATPITDFNDSNSVGILANSTTATVTITPVDDPGIEYPETVILTVSSTYYVQPGSPSSATVTIADNDNHYPVADDETYNVAVGGNLYVSAPGVLDGDNNGGDQYDSITPSMVTYPTKASGFTFNTDGSFSYIPASTTTAFTDTFVYKVTDTGGLEDTATVTINYQTTLVSTLTNNTLTPLLNNIYPTTMVPLTGNLCSTCGCTCYVGTAQDLQAYYNQGISDPKGTTEVALTTTHQPGTDVVFQGSTTVDGSTTDAYSKVPASYGTSDVRIAAQLDLSSKGNGRYAYSTTVSSDNVSGTITPVTGTFDVVNYGSSGGDPNQTTLRSLGNGWTFAGIPRLYRQNNSSGNGVFVTWGNGKSSWFDYTGGVFVAETGNNNKLIQNGGGDYTITDPWGKQFNFPSGGGDVSTRVERTGETTTYTWTAPGQLSQITGPHGETVSFSYTSGYLSSITDYAGRVTSFTHDGAGNLTSITRPDPDGAGGLSAPVLSYTYATGTSRMTRITQPDGEYEDFNYSTSGVYTGSTHSSSGGSTALQQRANIGLGGNSRANATNLVPPSAAGEYVADEMYRQTDFVRDTKGRVTSNTDPLGNTTTIVYNSAGRPTLVTEPDPDGAGGAAAPETEFTYDGSNRLTRVDYPNGAYETWTYSGSSPESEPATYRDVHGGTWSYTRDSLGRVTAQTDPSGYVTAFTYDTTGDNPLTMTLPDPDGAGGLSSPVYTFAYNSAGRLATLTNPDSTTRTFTYNSAGDLLTVTDELSHVTTYAYDSLNRLTSLTLADPDGAGGLAAPVYTYTYDANNRRTSVTDPLGKTTNYEYTARGWLSKIILPDPDGAGGLSRPETAYAYNAAGQLTSMTDAAGGVTSYAYNNAGWVTSVTSPDPDGAGGLARPVTSFTYDHLGRVLTQTNPLGAVTEYVYDNAGNVVSVILPDPDGAGGVSSPVWTYDYTLGGRLLSAIDPLGNETDYDYTTAGLLDTVTLPDPDAAGGLSSPEYSYTYDHLGRTLTATDARGYVSSWVYNSMSRVTSTTLPDPDGGGGLSAPVTSYTYDSVGNVLTVTDPLSQVTTYAYDNLYRLTSVTAPDPDGGGGLSSPVTSYAYDANSRLTSVTDPLSHVTSYGYNYAGWLTTETLPDPDGGGGLSAPVTTYGYDILGRRTSLTDPTGNVTSWAYDGLSRVTSETNELSEVRTFEYNAASQLTKRTDRRGLAREFSYDNVGRMTAEVWKNGGSTVRTIAFAYNAASALTSVSDADSSYAYTYDNLGRVTNVDNNGTSGVPRVQLASAYDENSNRTSLSATITSTLDLLNSYTYDGLNRLTRVDQIGQGGGNAVAEKRVDFAYNARGQFSSIARYNDTTGGSTYEVATSAFTYDNIGRLTALDHTHSSTDLANYDWTYDAASRVTQFAYSHLVGGSGTSDYSYDNTNQVTAADHSGLTDESYSFDASGNRTGGGYSTGDDNQLESDGTFDYTYDDEGNRLTRTRISSSPADDKTVEYTWDHRNRLTKVKNKDENNATTQVVEYIYDVYDRKIGRKVDSDGDSDWDLVERYIYDGDDVALEFLDADGDGAGSQALSKRYLWGPAVDQLLAQEDVSKSINADDRVLWPLTDNRGSVRDIADQTGGVVNHIEYDSFGKPARILDGSGSSVALSTLPTRYLYTTREYDSLTDLQYNRARWYDPSTGKWLSVDPLGFAAGDTNLSRYVGNNATNAIDPTGRVIRFHDSTEETHAREERFLEILEELATDEITVVGALARKALSQATLVTVVFTDEVPHARCENGMVIFVADSPDFLPANYNRAGIALDGQHVDIIAQIVLGHELGHGIGGFDDPTPSYPVGGNVTVCENPLRRVLGVPERRDYNGQPIPTAEECDAVAEARRVQEAYPPPQPELPDTEFPVNPFDVFLERITRRVFE